MGQWHKQQEQPLRSLNEIVQVFRGAFAYGVRVLILAAEQTR